MKRLLICLSILLALTACSSQRENRRLIEWGWDTPRLQHIGAVLDVAQTLPFDGVVLDVESPLDDRGLSWTLFGSQPVDTAALDALAAEYGNLPWGRLTDNFLRLTIHPADVGWFEDWTVIYANAEAWARFARAMDFVGIMLDVEQYSDAHLFDLRQQRDWNEIGFDAYTKHVLGRGSEFMEALQRGYPGLTIMFTYALSVDLSPANPRRYELLIPFVEGMASAADPNVTLIDGYEHSYIYREEAQFREARTRMNALGESTAWSNPIRAGFGLWIDPVCGDGGLPPEGCGFSPDEFRNALTYAFNSSDRYVWLYSQKINWYTGQGIPQVWRDTLNTFRP